MTRRLFIKLSIKSALFLILPFSSGCLMDNRWVFAFIAAVLKRIGTLLGKDHNGDVFIQVADEVWNWFKCKEGYPVPYDPMDIDLEDCRNYPYPKDN